MSKYMIIKLINTKIIKNLERSQRKITCYIQGIKLHTRNNLLNTVDFSSEIMEARKHGNIISKAAKEKQNKQTKKTLPAQKN